MFSTHLGSNSLEGIFSLVRSLLLPVAISIMDLSLVIPPSVSQPLSLTSASWRVPQIKHPHPNPCLRLCVGRTQLRGQDHHAPSSWGLCLHLTKGSVPGSVGSAGGSSNHGGHCLSRVSLSSCFLLVPTPPAGRQRARLI